MEVSGRRGVKRVAAAVVLLAAVAFLGWLALHGDGYPGGFSRPWRIVAAVSVVIWSVASFLVGRWPEVVAWGQRGPVHSTLIGAAYAVVVLTLFWCAEGRPVDQALTFGAFAALIASLLDYFRKRRRARQLNEGSFS